MSLVGQDIDYKSLRHITGKTADWAEIAKDCVAFANARGGRLLIGIEDGENIAPKSQKIDLSIVEKTRPRIGELTVDVTPAVQCRVSPRTRGEFIEINISRSHSPASTSDVRVSDASKPLVGEEIQRPLSERNAQPWETLTSLAVPDHQFDEDKLSLFVNGIRASSRVKDSVKEKNDNELLYHYHMAIDGRLTNLGILCVGRSADRIRLGTSPVIQAIRYDNSRRKVFKQTWDDHTLTPMELVETVWHEIKDFSEFFEFPDGLFRQQIPAYDERVVRELLVNAIVHRPYTQRGDIFLNMFPDRMQIVNPGLLPLGVTPRNILHQSVRRNDALARVFHDLNFMEREGSGYDMLYEVLTSQGRPLPDVRERSDCVAVTIARLIIRPEVIDFLSKASQTYPLTQRERISLGILVQHEALTARQFAKILKLPDSYIAVNWFKRLLKWQIVNQSGRGPGTKYYVDPTILKSLKFPAHTTLARIGTPRLRALILEDLGRHSGAAFPEIHQRIGQEIPAHQVRRQIKYLIENGDIRYEGDRRWRRYWLK